MKGASDRSDGSANESADGREQLERLSQTICDIPGVNYSYEVRPGVPRTLTYLGPGMDALIGPRATAEFRNRVEHMFELVHPDDRQRLRHTADRGIETGETVDLDLRLRSDTGKYVWVRSICRPIRLGGGASRWHIILIDMTKHKQVEAALRLKQTQEQRLNRELDHRVRNNLASLMTLVDLTRDATTNVERFASSIRGRIEAMARAHSLLSQARWDPVSVRDLLDSLLPPECLGVIRFDGEHTLIPPSQATPLAMVFHELLMNSLKYGSLGATGGAVRVDWRAGTSAGGVDCVEWTWRESGGPRIEGDPPRGMGSALIDGFVRSDLRGTAELSYLCAGASHRFSMTLEELSGFCSSGGENDGIASPRYTHAR